MKKFITLVFAAIVLAGAPVQSVHAIGLALSRQNSSSVMPEPQISYSSVFNRLVDRIQGLAVILDTAVAKDRLFNYRFSIDCNSMMVQKDLVFANISYSINRLTVANTFGFGFIRTPFMRVWAGPQLALTYEFKNRNSAIFNPVLYNKIGSVVGVNIHAGNNMTFAVEMGLRTGFGFDMAKSPANSLVESKVEPIASVRLIFRSWDFFDPSGV
ncbi:MAG TPA: hypothetical protein PLM53_01665 [Spirochaetota bacterium]|nr:hypothetical protein [Spirochaetota bacterium]HPC41120.1 hypothetical protein [Spirochaetota bacterium]HPL15541.1 hypothetical protein [Spirochaetota bacterium]HQF07040.1 hypothetical protein [Spirochaetota bacterium]HQH95777.1 hypothetical protein [Spirochaetota bacterium]